MENIVFLDDGSVWERKIVNSKTTKWIQKERQYSQEPFDEVLKYFKTDALNLNADGIINLVDTSLIYSPGYPYDYMNDSERKRHGYIQCNCCQKGKSCGMLKYRNPQLRKTIWKQKSKV